MTSPRQSVFSLGFKSEINAEMGQKVSTVVF